MQPEAYVLDIDPAKSHATSRAPRQCACGAEIPVAPGMFQSSCCAACQQALDAGLEAKMIETGHAGGWPLYWTGMERYPGARRTYRVNGTVGTFYGHRSWPVTAVHTGRHNIAGQQYRLYWRVAGQWWTGVQFGENTQLVRGARAIRAR